MKIKSIMVVTLFYLCLINFPVQASNCTPEHITVQENGKYQSTCLWGKNDADAKMQIVIDVNKSLGGVNANCVFEQAQRSDEKVVISIPSVSFSFFAVHSLSIDLPPQQSIFYIQAYREDYNWFWKMLGYSPYVPGSKLTCTFTPFK